MKKLGMMALAALLVVAFTLPAYALETEFRGYWRTRFFTNQNFTGEDVTEAKDFSWVDTRTRLRFTTIFHENLKFVNRFEFDGQWGSATGSRSAAGAGNRGYGELNADGANIEIKNSYADFNLGPVNAKVGIQGVRLARGFLIDTDAAGAVVTFQGGNFALPLMWFKGNEGGTGLDANDFDVDVFGIAPSFNAGGVSINPYALYMYSEDISDFQSKYGRANEPNLTGFDELNAWYVGADIDFSFDPVSFWLTGIYQGGDVDPIGGGDSVDMNAYLAAVGFNVGLGFGGLHGEAFYASGNDPDDADEVEEFFVPGYWESHYWAEIMGFGIFDWDVSNNSPADEIGDIMAANIGFTLKPVDKLSVALDVWYAQLAEEITLADGSTEDYLGTEVDLVITYELVENLNLDLVGAYLFAGDATTEGAADDADPYEVGARLSLSF
jgi:hypothetical protein